MKPSKIKPSKIGNAKGQYVSQLEHELLWTVVRRVNEAMTAQMSGHNKWQKVQDSLDELEDEYADPKEI